ncbi:MAG: valine--tRNA ligase [Clostridiales Family XIII bacterium]|jgi:valyl-tRNA synthetase|nr:valine--tRNA ligase [Clostridiales Family XIII bacterium]
MARNLEKTYDPSAFESRIYRDWEESGCFHAEPDDKRKPFAIVMPPPNITGRLHMGHALDQTLQDVLTRWKRLQGYCTLWLPGTDHASIATEVKVADETLATEGKTKEELGREAFLDRVWTWKKLYGDGITEQQRRLGNSCDWARERFTMDEGCNKAVVEFFVRLHEKGLIYRGNRLINWCPTCGTSLSDAEVEHEDISGAYWYVRYPAADGGAGLVVATSRPETMFGDVAVAVRADDARYGDMIGKCVILPCVGREIPVIADPYPDPAKGTGAVKITPAHDPNDYEVGVRHGLPKIVCIDFDARMTAEAGQYAGMDRFACREAWVKTLDESGYLVKTENIVSPTGKCYRCGTVVEPMLSDQWFVRMEALAKPAAEAAKDGRLIHVPDRFGKVYLHWLEDIRDWCVSRQLWWGHRIPAYYCESCGEPVVAREKPTVCPVCGGGAFRQDEDVLDTWFSSALWPFSTLGWPEQTRDLSYFYPTSVLVTGYDIIFFWVVRMAFSGLECMGEIPFGHVLVHGLVRDSLGRKMSKSLNNGVDPLQVIDAYGADALRFMLISGSSPGNDMRYSDDKVESARNFANKLWNAARFVIMNLDGEAEIPQPDESVLRPEDRWVLSKVNETAAEITRNMEKFELSLALQKIYELIRETYCDWYIELVKERLYGTDETQRGAARYVLVSALSDLLRLLHPYMPFITEEIWGYLHTGGKLISDRWPAYDGELRARYAEASAQIELGMEIIRSVRNIRAEAEAPPTRRLTVTAVTADPQKATAIAAVSAHIRRLANVAAIVSVDPGADGGKGDGTSARIPEDAASALAAGVELYVPLDDLLDYRAERERLAKEQTKLKGEIDRLGVKLSNGKFLSKAPEAVVLAEREKLAKAEDGYAKVLARAEAIRDK